MPYAGGSRRIRGERAMVTVDEFSRLVSVIYAAALSPQHWDDAVGDIHRTFDRAFGAVASVSLSRADGAGRTIIRTTLSSAAPRQYDEYYSRIDHVLQAVEAGPVGCVRTGAELIVPHARSEFCSDWLRPNEIEDGVFVRLTDGPSATCLLVVAFEPFDTERARLMSVLVPHVQQTLCTQHKLANLTGGRADLVGALDAVRHGLLVVASGNQLVHVNSAAEAILRAHDGLGVSAGCLTAASPHADQQLHRAVEGAVAGGGCEVRGGRSFTCGRPSGMRPYVIHVLPLHRRDSDEMLRRALALVLIVDPEHEAEPVAALLRRLYGLTHTEAEVAIQMMRGGTLKQISEQLSISPTTVRTHLQHVFDKTDTHRQAELVRLLLPLTT